MKKFGHCLCFYSLIKVSLIKWCHRAEYNNTSSNRELLIIKNRLNPFPDLCAHYSFAGFSAAPKKKYTFSNCENILIKKNFQLSVIFF